MSGERRGPGLDLTLNGVTHRVELIPVEDDRWDYMLTVWSIGGEGRALLTRNDCDRLETFLKSGGRYDPGYTPDPRCRCAGNKAHDRGDEDICIFEVES